MYQHLRGRIHDLSLTHVVMDVQGVGYHCRIPLSTYDKLKGVEQVLLLTHLHVREDAMSLFGFATRPERELFRLVLSVGGVGPTIALAALSALRPAEVVRAVSERDIGALQRIKGVGRKLAERLVVELRDRVDDLAGELGTRAPATQLDGASEDEPRSRESSDAVKALVELGYDLKAVRQRIAQLERQPDDDGEALSAEGLVRAFLRSEKASAR